MSRLNRTLLAFNLLAGLVLCALLLARGAGRVAASAGWSADEVRILAAPDTEIPRVGARLLLELGHELAADEAEASGAGAELDIGLRIEPEVPLLARRHGPTRIELVFPGVELLPGRTYHVHAARPLVARDGRTLAAGPLTSFTTPPVSLRDAAVESPRSAGGTESLLLTFDAPVVEADVRGRTRLFDARTGAPIAAEVREVRFGGAPCYRVEPAHALPDAVRLVLEPGLVARGGEHGTPRLERTITLRQPLHLRTAELRDGGLELAFNHTIDSPAFETLGDWIELDPPLAFQVHPLGSRLRLVGQFPPGSVLGLRLRAGFPGAGVAQLGEDARRSFLVPDLPPRVAFAQRGTVLSARAKPALELTTTNVTELRIGARRVYPNNVVRLLQEGDPRAMQVPRWTHLELAGVQNEPLRTRIDLREVLGDAAPRGLYSIELRHGDGWPRTHRTLHVTDLGVSLRLGAGTAALQVLSIADGTGISAAQIALVSTRNQTLATAVTDADGVAFLRWPAGGDEPFLVHARHGEDETFVDLAGFAVELGEAAPGGRPFAARHPEAYVWPTRGIVRPGETLSAAVLVRRADGRAAAGTTVELAWVAPNGRAAERRRVEVPGSGLLTAHFDLGLGAAAGAWRVEARLAAGGPLLGSATVQVEAFVPQRLEADVEVLETPVLGRAARVRVRGRWLDGSPAAGSPVTLFPRLLAGTFTAAGLEDFVFASGDVGPPPGDLAPLSAVLDEEGIAELQVELPARAAHQVLRAELLAEVQDPSGRAVRAAAATLVLRPGFLLGVRATTNGAELCGLDAAGAPLAGELHATVRLERRRWTWSYRELDGQRWRWETQVEPTVLREWSVNLVDGRAALEIDLPADEGGWLVLVATSGEQRAETNIGPAHRRPDRLRVTGPAEPVAAGGRARIDVESPAAGRAFVSLETREVLAASVIELVAGHNEIELDVPAGLELPNLHAVVTLTRPATEVRAGQGPAWLAGATSIALARPELASAARLTVPDELLPESELRCVIDAPAATRALVAVVDEGVLQITGHRDPDPIAFFLARRRPATRGADSLSALLEDAVFDPGAKTGGDEDGGVALTVGSISPRIRPLALVGELALDAGGRGEIAFRLPAYEGRVRVLLLAAGPDVLAGRAASTVVRAPLGLQASGPRAPAPGDRFAVTVTLRNGTGTRGDALVHALVHGGLELEDDAPLVVSLAPDEIQSRDLWVRVMHPPEGGEVARVELRAELCGERRTVAQEFDVRAARRHAHEHHGLGFASAGELTISADFVASGLRAVLEADAAPYAQLRPALEALVEYPYGCVEQTTSRGFALLACRTLLERIYGGEDGVPEAARLVQVAVDRLLGMQGFGGGFGWWPGAREEYAFGTLYAVDFLLAAREAGFEVAEPALRAGLARVRHFAERGADPSTQCWAIEVLARAGEPLRPRARWLAAQAVTAEDHALLALALDRYGDAELARAALDASLAAAPQDDGGTVGPRELTGLLRSPLRLDALRLRARLALDPSDGALPLLAARLRAAVLSPERATTQELGQALRALARYELAQREGELRFAGGTLDDAPLPALVGKRVELAVRPGSVLRWEGGGAGHGLLRVTGFRTDTGARMDEPSRASVSTLRRRYFDPTTGAETTSFVRGRVYEVHLSGESARPLPNLVLADFLPAGLEAEHPLPGAPAPPGVLVERRDDRVLFFPGGASAGTFRHVHRVRATFPGMYTAAPPVAEVMYQPGASFVGETPDTVEVLP